MLEIMITRSYQWRSIEDGKVKSKRMKDVLHTQLKTLSSSGVLKTHDACLSRYTSDYHIEKHLNRKRKE